MEPPPDGAPGPRAPETSREPRPARAAPPEVWPFVRSLSPQIRAALDGATAHPVGLVIVHADRDRDELPAALSDTPPGHQVVASPLARCRALALLMCPEAARVFDDELPVGGAAALVIGPHGAGVVSFQLASHEH